MGKLCIRGEKSLVKLRPVFTDIGRCEGELQSSHKKPTRSLSLTIDVFRNLLQIFIFKSIIL